MSLTTITHSKPFYVAAGAGDLAVKAIREVPTRLTSLMVGPGDVVRAVTTVGAETAALPAKAQTVASGVAADVSGRADAVYDELLTRGRRVVRRIRRQQATEDLKKQATTTVRRTKATATTARKSAAETRTATKRATTTARTRATTTRTVAKGAATSARKTAKAAASAAADSEAKVGT